MKYETFEKLQLRGTIFMELKYFNFCYALSTHGKEIATFVSKSKKKYKKIKDKRSNTIHMEPKKKDLWLKKKEKNKRTILFSNNIVLYANMVPSKKTKASNCKIFQIHFFFVFAKQSS